MARNVKSGASDIAAFAKENDVVITDTQAEQMAESLMNAGDHYPSAVSAASNFCASMGVKFTSEQCDELAEKFAGNKENRPAPQPATVKVIDPLLGDPTRQTAAPPARQPGDPRGDPNRPRPGGPAPGGKAPD